LKQENSYLNLLQELVKESESGQLVKDRTGVGTYNLFHKTLRFDLSKSFPLLTTKRMSLKSVVGELLWFISGSTNANLLKEKYGCTIWEEWKDEEGELGKVYGHQWREFGSLWLYDNVPEEWYLAQEGFDQINWLINEIKTNSTSRRLYVTAANPNDRYEQALDCCHNYFQVVIKNGKLNLYFQMRSTDVFLGLPYNIASYAILAHMLALETGYEVGELVYSGVDVHLYSNHIEQAKEQLKREPYESPKLKINKKPFFDYEIDDFELEGYQCHPVIKAPVAV
jgi:thymidylate synthase